MICKHYGVRSGSAFVLSNGIFATAGSERERYFAKVQHIPVSGTHLNRVAAVNQLSREIESGQYTVEAAAQALEDIKNMPGKRKSTQVLASGVGSAAFCYLFGGNMGDTLCALCAGLVLYLYVLYVSAPRLSKIDLDGGQLIDRILDSAKQKGTGRWASIESLKQGVDISMIDQALLDANGIPKKSRVDILRTVQAEGQRLLAGGINLQLDNGVQQFLHIKGRM